MVDEGPQLELDDLVYILIDFEKWIEILMISVAKQSP